MDCPYLYRKGGSFDASANSGLRLRSANGLRWLSEVEAVEALKSHK